MTDIIFDNQGSIIVLTPVSPDGERWLDGNVFRLNGPSVSVDHRYADSIIDAAIDNGLDVRVTEVALPPHGKGGTTVTSERAQAPLDGGCVVC